MFKIIQAVVRKDLRQYFADKKAVLISVLVPLGIAFFMATIFGSQSQSTRPATKIDVLVASESQPELQKLLKALSKVKDVNIIPSSIENARAQVKAGKAVLAMVVSDGFVDKMTVAFGDQTAQKPKAEFISDPSKRIESQMAQAQVSGGLMGSAVGAKYGEQFAPDAGGGMPFETQSTDLGPEKKVEQEKQRVASVAHVFCGMAIQGILFGAIEAAMQLMRDRQKGMLKRLTAAPISPRWFLLGRILSSAIKALFVLCIVLGMGMLLFKFRVSGSLLGLGLVLIASALMSACFGLFVSALGKTEAQSRGLSTLAVLAMAMLGGAWFPAFMFPGWVQTVSKLVPVRWAVDGLDAMIWRGLGLGDALPLAGVTLLFAVGFAAFGVWRFSWEPEAG
jgi:ABC-2 type transport system permease protein